MCGEIDEQAIVGQDLIEQARVMARMLGVQANAAQGQVPAGLEDPAARAAYMGALFRQGLAAALADLDRAEDDEKVDALACQAIALARLAGFLAGQLPPEADLYRSVIEAVTDGHSEPRALAREHKHQQDHLHGHSHDHDHDHDHSHHHH